MIELKSIKQLTNAINKAKHGKLFVQTTSVFRMYRVTNRENQNTYIVNFFVPNKRIYATCTCLAGRNNVACKHVAAAGSLHMMIAAEKQAA